MLSCILEKGDESKVGGIQHQFDGHEDSENIPPGNDTDDPKAKKDNTQKEIIVNHLVVPLLPAG
jgi:hypothetical protein